MNVREVLNSILYVSTTGCQRSALPKDLAPKSTAHDYFIMLDRCGTLKRIHEALYIAAREQAGKEVSPTTAIVDSQNAKAAKNGGSGHDPQGYDAGKNVTGRKRHTLVDTLGLLLNVIVLPANIQDRHAAIDLLRRTRSRFPFIERIFADGGYAGAKTAAMVGSTGCWKIEIVERSDAHCFVILPKRWLVERTFAWVSRNRRRMQEFEHYVSTAATFVRLTRQTACS